MNINLLFTLLLILHITSGSIALISAFTAMMTKKGAKIHRLAGSFFFYGMTCIFVTAIPMSIIKSNTFLFLIALFSYYLALSGWRYAKNRTGSASKFDWIIAGIMVIISILMLLYGSKLMLLHDFHGTVIVIFGVIGGISAVADLRYFQQKDITGKTRLSKHLGAMLGATIAALTAFTVTVVKISFLPQTLLWLTPTILITPIIIWWNKKVLTNKS